MTTTKEAALNIHTGVGFSVESDLSIFTTGGRANTELVRASLSAAALDEHDRVKVRPTFQVEAYDDIFALGDIAGTRNSKTAYVAGAIQAPVVANNIKALAQHRAATASGKTTTLRLKEHTPAPKGAMFVTTGRNTGAGALGDTLLGNFMVRTIKGGDMFTTRYNKELGWATPGQYPGAVQPRLPPPVATTAATAADVAK